ncbi:TetR/AcrR family transcriptional regulator [Aeromicrobium sp. CTD01-1L150]|uniref:TetR/AcrR family transcriptional regulator n=1 Tax=Aeromicrobium sp. CTD01-1L150 TaxID=3341830 RepID=UPI0035BF7134
MSEFIARAVMTNQECAVPTSARIDPPQRGTRPSNRRELILLAANDLFATRGFEHVSMSDVAEAVAIGPSALYRHFPGKHQLLLNVVEEQIRQFISVIESEDHRCLDDVFRAIAAHCLDHRDLGLLWQREARHLTQADRSTLRAQLRDAVDLIILRQQSSRPDMSPRTADLVTWAGLALLLSPSFHHVDLKRSGYESLLFQLTQRVRSIDPLPDPTEQVTSSGTLRWSSRREQVLECAVELFAEHTYASVSIEDIGTAAGIAASSIYSHFPSKLDMLKAALWRGNAHLQLSVAAALRQSTDPRQALRQIVDSYADFAVAHYGLVQITMAEVRNLPDPERETMVQLQRDHIGEWTHLLRQVHSELDASTGRVIVQAVITMINNVALTSHLRNQPGAAAALRALAEAVLDLRTHQGPI